jgi:dephospho-CoA kinase
MASQLPKVIGIVGPVRAGKTTVTKYLVERYGYSLASNSAILRAILSDMGVEQTRDNLSVLGNSLFSMFGNDLLARYRIETLGLDRIVVDGIRYSEELTRYRTIPQFKLLGVRAADEARFERALLNSEEFKDKELTRVKFDQMVFSRSEMHVPALLDQADKVIDNNASLSQLLSEVDQAIESWIA